MQPAAEDREAVGAALAEHYRLHERIGSGGMGVVYRAEQLTLGRTVAIKLLHPELAAIPELVKRFHVEARAASRLTHTGSVAIHDYGVTRDGTPFLVMEYVNGQSLTRVIRERWPVPLANVVDLAQQILTALGDAHAAGVVHGDIKSDNVLVAVGRDGVDHAKIVDYGLARLADDHDLDGEDEEGVAGTPEYMAPEVAAGDAPTELSDLYSVGCIVYEMLTGTMPFTGKTPGDVMRKQVHELILPPSLRRPDRDISVAFEMVVMKALAKEPKDRYPDAAAFAAALERVRPNLGDEIIWCACGRKLAPGSKQCPCGAKVPTLPPTVLEAPTRSWDADELGATRARLARGSGTPEAPLDERIRHLRGLIGTALTRGDLTEIAHGYLELARVLACGVGVRAAAMELEEAIDVLTAGVGPGAPRAPAFLWRMLHELACLQVTAGDRMKARVTAAHAHLQARRCHSATGRWQTHALIEQLRKSLPDTPGAP